MFRCELLGFPPFISVFPSFQFFPFNLLRDLVPSNIFLTLPFSLQPFPTTLAESLFSALFPFPGPILSPSIHRFLERKVSTGPPHLCLPSLSRLHYPAPTTLLELPCEAHQEFTHHQVVQRLHVSPASSHAYAHRCDTDQTSPRPSPFEILSSPGFSDTSHSLPISPQSLLAPLLLPLS